MTSSIACTSVAYALGYQFEVAEASSPSTVKEFFRLYNNFSMILVNSAPNALPLHYNIDYRVRVKAKVLIDGEEIWGNYGDPCIIRTPLAPETYMTACTETGIIPGGLSSVLYANTINYASKYRFTLINEAFGYHQIVEHSYNSFKLADFEVLSPLTAGATYSILVDVMLFGQYYIGKDCQLTVPFPAKMGLAAIPFEANAYPNPFADNFRIDVKTNSQSIIDIKVYDMIGRLMESRKVNVSETGTATIGDRYPTGVYNVIVTQDSTIRTLRVVKR